jgi:hypothetical protein
VLREIQFSIPHKEKRQTYGAKKFAALIGADHNDVIKKAAKF